MLIPLKDDNPTSRTPVVTLGLIAANVAVFVLQAAAPGGLNASVLRFGAIPLRIFHPGAAGLPEAAVPALLTLLTSMFLHGGLLHIGGNMLYLWIFGNNVEDVLGRARFLGFYLLSGLAAGLVQSVVLSGSDAPMIGASGAIAGVLGAYFVLFPRVRVRTFVFIIFIIGIFRIPAAWVLGFWFLLQVFSAGLGGGVAWFAHIGGFLTGAALIALSGKARLRPRFPVDTPPAF